MARDYDNKAVEHFLLPKQPNEGNFTSRVAYKATLKTYQCDHICVLNEHEQWKECEQVEDTCCKAEAAKVKAAAAKEHREAAEQCRWDNGLLQDPPPGPRSKGLSVDLRLVS